MSKRKNRCSFSVVTAAVFVAMLGALNAAIGAETTPNFYATMQAKFDKWDLNHDGMLSNDEILKAFRNPKVTGVSAAAIAVLQKMETHHIMKHEPLETFTLEQLSKMESEARPGHDKNESTFESCLKKIQIAQPNLFAHGLPQIGEIHQGGANDCYFLSVVASLAQERPGDLANLIEANEDGSYTVHFYGTPPIKVARPTAGEISAYNSDAGDGIWLPVMVKAYGKYKLNQGWNNQHSTPTAEDPIEAVAIHGGQCPPVMKLLTGHATKTSNPGEIAGDVRRRLSKAFAEHRMVIVGVPGHAMTGIAYDRESDQLKIWNPWGTSSKYKELDAKMDHGFFSIPISEFTEKCTHVVFEQSSAAEPDGPEKKHRQNHGHNLASAARNAGIQIWNNF